MNTGMLHIVKKTLGLSALLLMGLQASYSQAALVVCDTTYRDASLASAEGACKMGEGNTSLADVNADFASLAPWTHVGGIDAGNATDPLFSLSFLSGGFGQSSASGTWAISSSFWAQYGSAVLSFHVGNGKIVAPDHFEFLVTPGALSGAWSYTQTCTKGCGGGFSNMHLWGAGTPTGNEPPPVRVPEPSPVLLFALGLLGLAYARKKSA